MPSVASTPASARGADHPLHHQLADDEGDDRGREHADHDRKPDKEVEIFDREPGAKGAEHVIFAVSEVDGAQHAEDHRHADRHDGVDRARDDPVDDLLEDHGRTYRLLPRAVLIASGYWISAA